MLQVQQLGALKQEPPDPFMVYEAAVQVIGDVNLSLAAVNQSKSLALGMVTPGQLASLKDKLSDAHLYEVYKQIRDGLNRGGAQVQAPYVMIPQIEQLRLGKRGAWLYEATRLLIDGANRLAVLAGR